MYNKEIDKCNTLNQLFEIWKQAHIDESYESFLETYFKDDISRKYIFSKDGFLGENKKVKVLFVCREPHIGDNEEDCNEKNGDFFWVKEYAVKNKRTKYYKLMIKCLEDLKIDCSIEDCAYININKRGGERKCDMNKLKAYAEQYKDFIVKEIKIVNPEVVVFLGKLDSSIYEIVKEGCSDNTSLYLYSRHPSVYWKRLLPEKMNY